MKICFYCDSIFTFGGVQRVLAEIARGLSVRHQVTILTADDPALENTEMYGLSEARISYRYISYPALPFYTYYPCKAYSLCYKKILPQNKLTTRMYAYSSFPGLYRQILSRALNEGQYDVIVGVHAYPAIYLSTVRRQVKAKMIGWLHNSVDAFFQRPGTWFWGAEKRFSYQMGLLDKVVVLTHTDQEYYRSCMNLATQVIYNPLSLQIQGKGGPEHKKFLAVGRFTPRHKGFDLLIKAFAEYARKHSEWNLDIVGEGPEEELYRSLIAEHHLEDRVTLYPFTNQIQTFYARSSVYILSSRWEGFGLVWIEAMAHGLPVIASDLPVVKELLADSGNAVLFENENIHDLAQKMEEMVARENLPEMGEISCREAERFRLGNILPQWEQLISR